MASTRVVTVSYKIHEGENYLFSERDTTYEEWMAYGKQLSKRYSNIQWFVGDWINLGETLFGEKYAQALDDLAFAYGTLRNYASVCARIPADNRNSKLRFHQTKHVACLQPSEQKSVIDFAIKHNLTGDEILETVNKIVGKDKQVRESYEGTAMTYESGNGHIFLLVDLHDEALCRKLNTKKVIVKLKE